MAAGPSRCAWGRVAWLRCPQIGDAQPLRMAACPCWAALPTLKAQDCTRCTMPEGKAYSTANRRAQHRHGAAGGRDGVDRLRVWLLSLVAVHAARTCWPARPTLKAQDCTRCTYRRARPAAQQAGECSTGAVLLVVVAVLIASRWCGCSPLPLRITACPCWAARPMQGAQGCTS